MRLLPFGALLSGLLGAFGAAPPQDVAPPLFSVKSELVTLQVTVTDRRGEFVTGLGREHFTVYDSGEQQPIEFFMNGDVPVTLGLLIDSSSSMRSRRQDVTAAAAAFVALSHPGDEFFTLNFNEAVWPGLPPGVAFTEDPNQLRAAVAAAPARGMTAVFDAVSRALDHLQVGTRDRKVLIVVSDGGDNASSHTLEAVLEGARRTSAVIYAVTLFDRDDRDAKPHLLRRLARDTGGQAFTPNRADEVVGAFTQIARDIRSGYTIGFAAADAPGGGFRSIRVVADAGDGRPLVARTRAGYYADPSRGAIK